MSINWNDVFDRCASSPYLKLKNSPQDNYWKMIKKYQGKKKRR